MNLETLKNNYAQEQGYEDWADLYRRAGYYDEKVFFMHEDAVIILAEKAALENAAESIDFKMINTINEKKEDKVVCRYDYTSVIVDRTSITKPKNLIR